MAKVSEEVATQLKHAWEQMAPNFQDFVNARGLDGNYKQLIQAKLPPDIFPELEEYAQGMRTMSGMLADDLRILTSIHETNPTRIGAQVRGANETARARESDYKLTAAGWWDKKLNKGRRLDRTVYQAQTSLGVHAVWLRWKKQIISMDGKRPVSDCPVFIEKTLVDCIRWNGDYDNPDFWLRYTTSVIDCDLKNSKGERPVYTDEDGSVLDWIVGEQFPPEHYKNNVGKEIEINVRDVAVPGTKCPLDGCYHAKRKITVYVCKKDGKPEDYEEIESYDSPFEKCSFILVGGDIQETERDPHLIFRPSAWVLIALVDEYNRTLNLLDIMMRQELGDESKYIDGSSTTPEMYNAWLQNREGGSDGTVEKPQKGSRDIRFLPGTVRSYGQPSTDLLKVRLGEIKQEYALRRPNPALTGQMAISEVSATAAAMQVQGAGVNIGPDLANWDAGIVRILEEIRHGIRFTGHFEPDDEQTKYVSVVTGKERVYGSKGKPGDEVFLDAKKCATPVDFSAMTSKDTPAEQKERRMLALTGLHEGIYVMDDVDEAWDIFDSEMQNEKRAEARVDMLLDPIFDRIVAMISSGMATARTGIDFGNLLGVNQLMPEEKEEGQTYNTLAANTAQTAPGVELPAVGGPAGGSSGLA